MAVSPDGKLAFVTNTMTTRSGGKLVSPSISVIDVRVSAGDDTIYVAGHEAGRNGP